MDDSNYDADELLQEAVDGGYVDEHSAAYGIARQCNDRGYETLSATQKTIYDRQVLPHLATLQTKRDVEERKRGMPD
jgi:enoyl-[acyl-carrier-protein] reductase (NADH)